jgi:hypothetical protein
MQATELADVFVEGLKQGPVADHASIYQVPMPPKPDRQLNLHVSTHRVLLRTELQQRRKRSKKAEGDEQSTSHPR